MDTIATVTVVIRPVQTGRLVDFVGEDPVQVLEAAQSHWSLCDEALRGPAPVLYRSSGQYAATVRERGGE